MSISFEEVLEENCVFVICPDCKKQNKGYFTNARVDRETVPSGWYCYDIRHSDSGSFCLLKTYVLVNHAGTFLTQTEFIFKRREVAEQYHYFSGKGTYTFE